MHDGQVLTQTAPSRNTTGYLELLYLELLQTLDRTYPTGDLYLVADNLASHTSGPIREWLEAHPRLRHAFIPVGAAWLNLIEGWWRIFRRKAFAGQSLADHDDIAYVTRIAPLISTAMPDPGSGDALLLSPDGCVVASSTFYEERRSSPHLSWREEQQTGYTHLSPSARQVGAIILILDSNPLTSAS